MKKERRHDIIRKLINEYSVSTQNDLIDLLSKNGIMATQATISRDIKEMNLIKVQGKNGEVHYVESGREDPNNQKYGSMLAHSLNGIDFAGNIVCVKCFAGTANAACAAIDAMAFPQVVGTLAGDDTIFVLCRTKDEAKNFNDVLENLMRKL